MSRRYVTTLSLSIGGDEPTWEGEATVSYTVAWGAPERGPTYDCGGTPADPDEVDDITVTHMDGVSMAKRESGAFWATLLENHIECSDDLMAELLTDAMGSDADAREYAAESRREARWETL